MKYHLKLDSLSREDVEGIFMEKKEYWICFSRATKHWSFFMQTEQMTQSYVKGEWPKGYVHWKFTPLSQIKSEMINRFNDDQFELLMERLKNPHS